VTETELPSRYEPLSRLGQGGGGEVWAVRDRFTRREYALKLLAENAGSRELAALVRGVSGRFSCASSSGGRASKS
jgi:serine/threonine protein kinase